MPAKPNHRHAAFFFSNFGLGGIQRVRLALAEGLLARGWQVDLIVVDGTGPLRQQVPAGATVIDLQARGGLAAFGALVRALRQRKPSAVVASQPHLNTLALLARAVAGYHGRVIVCEHIAVLQHAQNSRSWKEWFNPLLAWLFYRFADAVVGVSRETARQVLQVSGLPPEKVHVIYNPISAPRLEQMAAEPAGQGWLGEPGQRVVVGAGRLTTQKDFATLIDAFALVHQRQPDTRLLILGEGEEQQALQEKIGALGLADVARLAGFLPNPFPVFSAASVFVLSSRWEGFGNVLVEALACGTPVVSTDCPFGPAEILEDGKYGALAPVGDAEGLARAILETLDAPMAAEQCKARAAEFSLERILPQYETLMEG